MQPEFRQRYELRGKMLHLMGENVQALSREELYAVIGYLVDPAHDPELIDDLAATSPDEADTTQRHTAARTDKGTSKPTPTDSVPDPVEDPPSNEGLPEG